jgi:hypothetical protein
VVDAFLQYTWSDVFTDTITVANVEAFGYIIAGFVYVKNGGKSRLMMSVSMATISDLTCVTFAVKDVVDTKAKNIEVSILIMAIRFSLSVSFNSLLLVTFSSFPTIYLCTIFGILNFIGRLFGLIGPSYDQTGLTGAKIGMILATLFTSVVAWFGLRKE